jgi:lysine/ornithine N-monooxygenase
MESNREPLFVSEGLELANSVIKDTIHQDELIKWKIKHLGKSQSNRDTATSGTIGPNYWRSFLHHHPMLRQKKHATFDQKKDDFVKSELFQWIYDQIYTKQVRTWIDI